MSVIRLAARKHPVTYFPDISGREIIHLPVAPQITAKTRFSSVHPKKVSFMMPHEAICLLDEVMQKRGDEISMVAISGPGDPLAVPDTTLETLRLVRKNYPGVGLGLRSLGCGCARFAGALAEAGTDYVEMIVNGVQPEIIEKLYAWIRPGLKTLKLAEAAELLVREQKNGVPALKYQGIAVSINTTIYMGHNEDHIGKICRTMKELGADTVSVTGYEPESGAEVVLAPPDPGILQQARETAARYLECVRPLLSMSSRCTGPEQKHGSLSLPQPDQRRPNVAVISSNGIDVDLHLGKAARILIYGPREDGLPCLLEYRVAPDPGTGAARWVKLAELLSDCCGLFAAQAGATPRQILSEQNLPVFLSEAQIEPLVDTLYGGGKKKLRNR
jgi:nitrogen fixation protein NifB